MERIEQAGKISPNLISSSIILDKEKNLLKQSNNFKDSVWSKVGLSINEISETAPNGDKINQTVTASTKESSYRCIMQTVNEKRGNFEFSVWLKGSGTVSLKLQEAGNDYTNYKTKEVTLTKYWKKHTITSKKDYDNNGLRAVIIGIDKDDELLIWTPTLIKLP